MTVRVGVIGAGVMGADHVATLHRSVRGAAVGAIADVDPDRARAAAMPGAEVLDDAATLIADAGDGRLLGAVGLHNIDPESGRCSAGYWVAASERRRGAARNRGCSRSSRRGRR